MITSARTLNGMVKQLTDEKVRTLRSAMGGELNVREATKNIKGSFLNMAFGELLHLYSDVNKGIYSGKYPATESQWFWKAKDCNLTDREGIYFNAPVSTYNDHYRNQGY